MPRRDTAVSVYQANDQTALIRIQGAFAIGAQAPFEQAYAQTERAGAIVLDMSRMEYMNGYGIALLVTLLRRARTQGQRVSAFGLCEHYRTLMGLTRLDRFIQLVDSREQALSTGLNQI